MRLPRLLVCFVLILAVISGRAAGQFGGTGLAEQPPPGQWSRQSHLLPRLPQIKGQEPEDLAVREKLRQPISIAERGLPFAQAMSLLADELGLTIYLDPEGI